MNQVSAFAYDQARMSEINQLSAKIVELQRQLDHEMGVNDKLNDRNIDLKEQVDSLKERLKVRVHPSSIEKLTRYAREQDRQIQRLKRGLVYALDLVPDTDQNTRHKESLRELYRENA